MDLKGEIERIVREGLKTLMKKAEQLWPGDRNQVLERNLAHYVGAAMPKKFSVVYEYPFELPKTKSSKKTKKRNYLDMVALSRTDDVLVLAESKRALKGIPAAVTAVKADVDRISQAKLDCWNYDTTRSQDLQAKTTFGVVLVSFSAEPGRRDRAELLRDELSAKAGLGEWGELEVHRDCTYFATYKVWELAPRKQRHRG